MLSPLSNLFIISSPNLKLNRNSIGDLGVCSLLSPLANLLNLLSLTLNLGFN